MTTSPYFIDGPAIVSVSGGRTSGFMLAKIVEAHGGRLPDDVIPVFCNTGLEHCATYAFLRELGERVAPIKWLEYVSAKETKEVSFYTASRDGQPFTEVIRTRKGLPTPVARYCTTELKIHATHRWAKPILGPEYVMAIGLRADEQRRVSKVRNGGMHDGIERALPLADSGDTLADVLAFWASQPFDLRLPGDDAAFGNCVGCFLKTKDRLLRVARHSPEYFDWWIITEGEHASDNPLNNRFRLDRPSYANLVKQALSQSLMFDGEEDALPCACTE